MGPVCDKSATVLAVPAQCSPFVGHHSIFAQTYRELALSWPSFSDFLWIHMALARCYIAGSVNFRSPRRRSPSWFCRSAWFVCFFFTKHFDHPTQRVLFSCIPITCECCTYRLINSRPARLLSKAGSSLCNSREQPNVFSPSLVYQGAVFPTFEILPLEVAVFILAFSK